MRRIFAWLGLGAATAALGAAMSAVGVPSSYLFAGVLLGLAVALARPMGALAVPPAAFAVAQAVTGVTLGTYLDPDSLRAIGDAWLPVALVSTGTLAVSLGAGLALARMTALDAPTAALGMIAGGASGIVTMARDLHADDRLVAFMQYARLLLIVLLTPLLIPLAFPGHHAAAAAGHESLLGPPLAWLLVPVVAAAGAIGGHALRVPAGMLLGPLVLAGVLTLTGVADGNLVVPPLMREAAFATIGLQVGLRFTVETVREVGRLLVPVFACVLLLLVASFGLAAALAATTPVSLLDAYLATTPGGLYAVLAVAAGAGANTTFIVAVQGLRLLVMVLLAPVAVRLLVGRPATVTL